MHAKQFSFLFSVITTLLCASLAGCVTLGPPAYRVAVVLPGDVPDAMNARGDFVGYNADRQRAFLYADGRRRELGTLGGSTSFALGINDEGEVVGTSGLPNGQDHAFLYRRGVMRDLGTLPGGTISVARDINNAGVIVGLAANRDGNGRAFIHANGRMRELGTLGGPFSDAFAINSRNTAVGYAGLPTGEEFPPFHAVLYEKGGTRDLGTLSGSGESIAFDINDAGHIVGLANERAFLYTARSGMVPLGSLGGTYSNAFAINNRGQVVGEAQTADFVAAFLYTGGRMLNINSLVDNASGIELYTAYDINDRGQILAYGCKVDFSCFTVRLDPVRRRLPR